MKRSINRGVGNEMRFSFDFQDSTADSTVFETTPSQSDALVRIQENELYIGTEQKILPELN